MVQEELRCDRLMNNNLLAGLFLICLISFLTGCDSSSSIGKIIDFEGKTELRNKNESFRPAKKDENIFVGSVIRTFADSRVDVFIDNKGVVRVGPDTFLEFADPGVNVSQKSGIATYFINDQKSEFNILTDFGITAVLGTVFELSISSKTVDLKVMEGKVSFGNLKGEKKVLTEKQQVQIDMAGKFSEIESFEANLETFKFKKENGQWIPATKP